MQLPTTNNAAVYDARDFVIQGVKSKRISNHITSVTNYQSMRE